MWEAELRLVPAKWLALRPTYYRIAAYHSFEARGGIFGLGRQRGDLFQVRGDLTFGRNWKGHVLWEHFAPGDFYAVRDAAHFLRLEVIYNCKRAP